MSTDSRESNSPELRSDPVESGTGDANWQVHVGQFEGPLDLLLHLVRSNDMDILDIPIFEIARQYNRYLDQMHQLNLEVASEYLVMAATLAYIKSRMMLPPDPTGEEEDPRAELTRQLLEYEKYKRAAEELEALEGRQDLFFGRPGPPPRELAGEFTIRAGLNDLVLAFERVLVRLEKDDLRYIVHREDFKVEVLMQRLIDRLERNPVVSLRALLADCRTRLERVVLFLALLELVRQYKVVAHQPDWRSDVSIETRSDRTPVNETESSEERP